MAANNPTRTTARRVARTPASARETRRALLLAAAEQFHTAGYHAASVSDIATDAGVTKGALYFHFPDKRALAEAVLAATNATCAALATRAAARGLDPLATLLAESDLIVAHLIEDPIVRGGTRLLHDLRPRSVPTARTAADPYDHIQGAVSAHLAAAADAELVRPCLGATPQRAHLAQCIVAAITGHHVICDLTGAEAELWDRVTAMWQDLLPLIATDPWLEHWRHNGWPHRPRPPVRPQGAHPGLESAEAAPPGRPRRGRP